MTALTLAVVSVLLAIASNIVAFPTPVPVESFRTGDRSVTPTHISSHNQSELSTSHNPDYSSHNPEDDPFGSIPCDMINCPQVDLMLHLGDNQCACAKGSIGWKRQVEPTTEQVLLNRFLPQPCKFPTGMNLEHYNAIQSSLFLLQDTLSSQSDFHEACAGRRDYENEVFGFRQSVFTQLCKPEIKVPVPPAGVDAARRKFTASTWIDTKIATQGLSAAAICSGLKSNKFETDGLDTQWMTSKVCE